MIRVSRTGTTRYRGVTYKPYQEFVIEDKDKDEMIKLGCVVIEEKVINPRKVEPTVSKKETAEKKEEPKFLKKDKKEKKVED